MAEYEKNLGGDGANNYDPSNAWRQKDPSTFKELCYRALEHARKEWSKDMRKGGTYDVQTQKGVLPVYFPDQREIVINATETLYDLFLSYFDDKATESINKIRIAITSSTKLYELKRIELRKSHGPRYYKDADSESEIFLTNYLLKLYRQLFRELILLFKRQNEFSTKRKLGAYD